MNKELAKHIADDLYKLWDSRWINEGFKHIVSADTILKAIDTYEGVEDG